MLSSFVSILTTSHCCSYTNTIATPMYGYATIILSHVLLMYTDLLETFNKLMYRENGVLITVNSIYVTAAL